MKRRNKYFLKEKDRLRLISEIQENRTAQRNLGWVQLEEPYQNGYIVSLVLREDVSRRMDAYIFQYIIDHFGVKTTTSKIEIFTKNFFGKNNHIRHKHDKDRISYPHIRDISERAYSELPQPIKKCFTESSTVSTWSGKQYYCNIPRFFFDIKIEKNWVTRVRVIDSVLISEEAELISELDRKYYGKAYPYGHAPKYFRKMLNRAQRTKSKQTLFRIINNEEDLEFEDNFRGAAWLYW